MQTRCTKFLLFEEDDDDDDDHNDDDEGAVAVRVIGSFENSLIFI